VGKGLKGCFFDYQETMIDIQKTQKTIRTQKKTMNCEYVYIENGDMDILGSLCTGLIWSLHY